VDEANLQQYDARVKAIKARIEELLPPLLVARKRYFQMRLD
jgi:hypothetical protein